MGNCWPKPVDTLPAATNKPPNPVIRDQSSNKKSSESNHRSSKGEGAEANGVVDHIHIDGKQNKSEHHQLPTPNGSGAPAAILHTKPKMFSYAELRSATRNFRPDTVLGEGGFGRVFKGWLDDKTLAPSRVGAGIAVAVKKCNPDSDQGLKEWQAEVKFLGKFCHPNLVRLLGYCWEDKEFLLVYEYMQKGSLETHLFRKGGEILPWDIRLRIAIDAARGLAFLHTTEKQVIYRDFKAANILLDGDFNAKLSDFGLAKLGPGEGESHVTTRVVGTYGYAAPEYMATGHLYVKSDVYGFGVVLLELISGLRVLDLNRPNGEHNLVDWAKPLLPEKRRLRKVMDFRLEGQYPSKAAFQTAELILKCLEPDPKKRPSMEEIVETLEQIKTLKVKPKDSKATQKQEDRRHQRSPLRSKYPSGPSAGGTAGVGAHHHLPIAKSY